jgi:pimeloyl-ACP methyl ester carboxylesterase
MSVVKEGVLECDGLSLRYAEAGEGEAVIVFPAEEGGRFDDVAEALSSRYRVLAIDVPVGAGKAPDLAKQLTRGLARIGTTSFNVVGESRGAALALAQALYTPEQVQRLVLLSPLLEVVQHPEFEAELGKIATPTLVLVGTRDRSGARDAGHVCRERIPACHLVLVYEAGQALLADRREACLTPINEFLEQGEGFIVFHESHLVHS